MMANRIGDTAKDGFLATGGVIGALGASSCCVLPLAFAATGVGGAWIGTLAKFAPYQSIFLAVASLCIGLGLWRAYRRNRTACDGPQCGTSASRRLTRASLWLGAALLIVAGSVEWWARLLA